MKLTPSERETLRAACDALVPAFEGEAGLYGRRASDLGVDKTLAETVEGLLTPASARDFRRILRVFDSRWYNFLLTGRPVRFGGLGPAEKERYLSSWRDSSIPLKRTAFQAFKRLVCFLNYTVTGPAGSNPNWADIGYPGPSGDAPTPLDEALRIKPFSPSADTKLECDVCVVGSGAGGSVIADRLSTAGLDVVVLEQGEYETPETFMQSELRMMQKLFLQSGTASSKDLSFVLLAGRGAGGGTTVNWNTCLKPPDRVRREWSEQYGLSEAAGPVFSSYLDGVWRDLRVNDRESQRNPNNQVLWDGCKALGYREGSDYAVIHRNAVGCDERCDFCTYGCIYACKQSTGMNYLPRAYQKGARFLFNVRVERVEVEGDRATGVLGMQHSGGVHSVEVKAKAVVAACGAVETPALLLRSGIRDRNVGNYLRLDPTVAVGGVFDRAVDPWAGPPQTVSVWKFIDLDGSYHGFWVEAAPAHPGLFALSIPWAGGRQHKDFMRTSYSRSSASIVLLRERSWGRVGVDSDGHPVVTYDLGREDKETLMRGMEETARILAAAGARRVWTAHSEELSAGSGAAKVTPSELDAFSSEIRRRGIVYNRMMLFSAHLMGSVRMSADPSKGPTSPSGELHSVKNLFIGDASVFPTTPAVNPMVSIMAFAHGTAESIIKAVRK